MRPAPSAPRRANAAAPTFSLAQKRFGLSGIGVRDQASADPAMPAHRHSFFQVFFVAAGRALHEIDGRAVQAEAGSIFFIRPFAVHRLEFGADAECYLLYFDAAALLGNGAGAATDFDDAQLMHVPELAPFAWQPQGSYRLDAAETAEARARCRRIQRACLARGPYDAAEARAELTLLLAGVGRKYHASVHKPLGQMGRVLPLDARVRRTLDFLRANFRRELTLAEAAREVSLTGNYLSLLLKRTLGQSFKQLLDELRLEHARELLAHTELPIQRIALDCGFVNPTHFARRFKAFTARTPALYRRAQRAGLFPNRSEP